MRFDLGSSRAPNLGMVVASGTVAARVSVIVASTGVGTSSISDGGL